MIVPTSGEGKPHIAVEIAPDSVERDGYLASLQLAQLKIGEAIRNPIENIENC